jgi:hypothetical protein
MPTSGSAEIATVYRLLDGSLQHARCGQRLALQRRGTEELHFYCLACTESLWLALSVLVRPVADDGRIRLPWSEHGDG